MRDPFPIHPNVTLGLIAALLFLPALQFQFAYDDFYQILYNSTVSNQVNSLGAFFAPFTTATFPGDLYRPLAVFSFRLGFLLHHSTPLVEHLINIALHVACVILTYKAFTVHGISTSAAFLAGLLFAVHPIHVEPVANVVGRSELLAAAFSLLAIINVSHVWRSTLFALLAFFSKESSLALVVMLPLFAPLHHRIRLWPVLGAAFVYLAVRYLILDSNFLIHTKTAVFLAENPYATLSFPERVLPAFATLGHYIYNFILPISLSADYSGSFVSFWSDFLSLQTACYVGILLCYVTLLWIYRMQPWARFGCFGVLGFLLTCNLLVPIGTIMGDRLAYLPSVGFCAFLIGISEHFIPRKIVVQASVALVIIGSSIISIVRIPIWSDNYTLFSATVRDNPHSPKAAFNLGLEEFHRRRDLVAARRWFLRSLELNPEDLRTAEYLMNIAILQGHVTQARRLAEGILERQPNNSRIRKSLEQLGKSTPAP